MELICPSCEARYQVPEASIGEKGRQVSCMSCGHSWHAFPPLFLGSAAAPPTSASPGIDWQSPPGPGRSTAAFPHAAPEARPAPPRPSEPPSAAEPPRPSEPQRLSEAQRATESSRSEQLAEIREMLAEVQSEERAAAAMTPEDDEETRIAPAPRPETAGPRAEARGPSGAEAALPVAAGGGPGGPAETSGEDTEDAGDEDPLRRRMAMHDRKRADVEKLRRRHDRRARRHERARQAGSGAFLTGFLLIVMIAAVMTAIYVLQPQIVARMPESEPMLNEYVATVDSIRVSIAEGFETARAWVLDLIEKAA